MCLNLKARPFGFWLTVSSLASILCLCCRWSFMPLNCLVLTFCFLSINITLMFAPLRQRSYYCEIPLFSLLCPIWKCLGAIRSNSPWMDLVPCEHNAVWSKVSYTPWKSAGYVSPMQYPSKIPNFAGRLHKPWSLLHSLPGCGGLSVRLFDSDWLVAHLQGRDHRSWLFTSSQRASSLSFYKGHNGYPLLFIDNSNNGFLCWKV